MHHAVFRLLAIKLDLEDLLVHSVTACFCDACDCTPSSWWQHDLVVVEKRILENTSENITTSDVIANLELAGRKVPLLGSTEGRHVDTTRNVDALGLVGDTLEWSLDTIVNGFP